MADSIDIKRAASLLARAIRRQEDYQRARQVEQAITGDGRIILDPNLNLGGTWNGRHPILGRIHLWADSGGNIRYKSSAPLSETDGTVIGGDEHDPVTVTDSTSIDLTITDQNLTAAAKFGTSAGTVAEGSALAAHTGNTSNPHGVTKSQVGLSNVPDVDARARSTHTGTQAISTVTSLQSALDAKRETSWTVDKYQTSNVTTSSAVAALSALSVPLGAVEKWTMEYHLRIGCNNTGGVKFGMSFPGGGIALARYIGTGSSATSLKTEITATDGQMTSGFNTFNSTFNVMTVAISIDTVSAGDMTVIIQPVTSGQTAYVQAGSYVTARRLS